MAVHVAHDFSRQEEDRTIDRAVHEKPLSRRFTRRVIIAEDDVDDQEILRHTLRLWVPVERMKFVNSGAELLDYLNVRGKFSGGRYPRKDSDQPPSLIILDLNMPGKSGIEALEEIKKDSRFESIPVIVLTGATNDHEIERVFSLGANAFLSKPFNKMEMAMALLRGFNFSPTT